MFFLVYLVGYLVPFFLQIFSSSYVFVIIANVSCLLSVITLFVYEFVQMNETGLTDYIEDFWNKMDVCNIVFYLMYFPLRVYLGEEPLIDMFAF